METCKTCGEQSAGYLEDSCIRGISVNHKRPPDDFPGCGYYKSRPPKSLEFEGYIAQVRRIDAGPQILIEIVVNTTTDVFPSLGRYKVRLELIGDK